MIIWLLGWDILITKLISESGRSFLVQCLMGLHEWGPKVILGGILLAVCFSPPSPFLPFPSQQMVPPPSGNLRVIPDTFLALMKPPIS